MSGLIMGSVALNYWFNVGRQPNDLDIVGVVFYKDVLVEEMPIKEFDEAIKYRETCYENAVKEEWSKL